MNGIGEAIEYPHIVSRETLRTPFLYDVLNITLHYSTFFTRINV